MGLLERIQPMQGDLFGIRETPTTTAPERRPSQRRLEIRPSLDDIKRDALNEIRHRMLACIAQAEEMPTSLHMLMCQMDKQRSYRLLVGKDLFGQLIVERHWGSMVTRRGGFRRSVHNPEDAATVRKLVLRTISTRGRHGYQMIGESGV